VVVGDETGAPGPRVGGQAVLEGVMMRAGSRACVAVRRPDGSIGTRMLRPAGWAMRAESVPFVRGLAALGESVVLGVEALVWSEGESGMRPADRRPAPMWLLLALSLVAVLVLVVVLPATLAGWVAGGTMWFGVVEAMARVGVLGTYLLAITGRDDVRRVFQYHGAEHLVVGGHETGQTMHAANLRGGSIHHPRCGTSFLLVVAAVAAVSHPILPVDPLALRFGARLVVVPLVAAVSYEVLLALGAVAARRPGGRIDRTLLWPQRFTTRRPDDDQVEVAIAALQGALGSPQSGPADEVPAGPREILRTPG